MDLQKIMCLFDSLIIEEYFGVIRSKSYLIVSEKFDSSHQRAVGVLRITLKLPMNFLNEFYQKFFDSGTIK